MLPTHTKALTDAALATSGKAEPTGLTTIFKAHPDLRMRYDSLTSQQRDNVRALAQVDETLAADTLRQVAYTPTVSASPETYPDNWLRGYDASDQTPTVTTWKGNELLRVSEAIGRYGFQFGRGKALVALDYLPEIERYVRSSGTINDKPGDRSEAVLMLPLPKGRTWILKPAQAVAIWQHRQAVAHFVHLRATDAELLYHMKATAQEDRGPRTHAKPHTQGSIAQGIGWLKAHACYPVRVPLLTAGTPTPTDPESGAPTLFDIGPAALTLTSPVIPDTATYTETAKPLALFATGAYIEKAPDRVKQATQTDTVEDLPLFAEGDPSPDLTVAPCLICGEDVPEGTGSQTADGEPICLGCIQTALS